MCPPLCSTGMEKKEVTPWCVFPVRFQDPPVMVARSPSTPLSLLLSQFPLTNVQQVPLSVSMCQAPVGHWGFGREGAWCPFAGSSQPGWGHRGAPVLPVDKDSVAPRECLPGAGEAEKGLLTGWALSRWRNLDRAEFKLRSAQRWLAQYLRTQNTEWLPLFGPHRLPSASLVLLLGSDCPFLEDSL